MFSISRKLCSKHACKTAAARQISPSQASHSKAAQICGRQEHGDKGLAGDKD